MVIGMEGWRDVGRRDEGKVGWMESGWMKGRLDGWRVGGWFSRQQGAKGPNPQIYNAVSSS